MTILDLLAPAGPDFDRLIVVGTGEPAEIKEQDWVGLGGAAMGALGKAQSGDGPLRTAGRRGSRRAAAADFALGMKLRAYAFDNYKTDGNATDDDGEPAQGAGRRSR